MTARAATIAGMAQGLLGRGGEGGQDLGPTRTPPPSPSEAEEADGSFWAAGDGGTEDPLVGLARSHPEAAVRFLQAVLLLGLLVGLLLPAPIVAFLGVTWEACSQCNRPLHVWAVVHCGLNLLQAPARMHFYVKLRRRPDAEGVQQVLGSSMWKGCRCLSFAGYTWFLIGVVWLINSDFHGACGGLSVLTLALIAVALLKPLLTIAAFRRYVPHDVHAGEAADTAPCGTLQEVIDSLAVVRYAANGRETGCAVCLVDFEEGESLRELPCGHKFHAPCIDRWLLKSSRCPLCMQEVDLPHPAHACSRC
mmetsp:Transcript_110207/g.312616  ORF Transcript_110207/g.312616 Transcript_110207/m.312616 type:complete len:307 (+) Transcript_110207:86-1006(+)